MVKIYRVNASIINCIESTARIFLKDGLVCAQYPDGKWECLSDSSIGGNLGLARDHMDFVGDLELSVFEAIVNAKRVIKE